MARFTHIIALLLFTSFTNATLELICALLGCGGPGTNQPALQPPPQVAAPPAQQPQVQAPPPAAAVPPPAAVQAPAPSHAAAYISSPPAAPSSLPPCSSEPPSWSQSSYPTTVVTVPHNGTATYKATAAAPNATFVQSNHASSLLRGAVGGASGSLSWITVALAVAALSGSL